MDRKGSLPCPQEPAISPYSELDESNSHLQTQFPYYLF
jgi:hypothetical protein